jgi:hypothetical protein
VTFDIPPEDVGPVIWKLLSAKHTTAIDLDFNHSPFTVTRNALDIIPHIIEDRLVIQSALRDTIDLKPIARRYAEWLDLAGRAVHHVAEQMLQWEEWITDEYAHMRLQVRAARESVAEASVAIRGIANTLPHAPCKAAVLEEQLAPIRLKLAKAHDKLAHCLAELSP